MNNNLPPQYFQQANPGQPNVNPPPYQTQPGYTMQQPNPMQQPYAAKNPYMTEQGYGPQQQGMNQQGMNQQGMNQQGMYQQGMNQPGNQIQQTNMNQQPITINVNNVQNAPVMAYPPIMMVARPPAIVRVVRPPRRIIFAFKTQHIALGIFLIVLGSIDIFIDPLLPVMFGFPYSLFLCSILMIISGSNSLCGVRKNDRCCMVSAMVLNIFMCIQFAAGTIVGITIALSNNMPRQTSYGVFLASYCILMFVLVIGDSGLICKDICCNEETETNTTVINETTTTIRREEHMRY